jgi:hypothetical protein
MSFELPLIMGRKDSMNGLPDKMLIHPEDLREAALGFTAGDRDDRLIHLGFSPTWNPRIFTDLLEIRAPDFFSGGMENPDTEVLDRVVQELRSWITESAGNIASDTDFNKRYRYIPDEYLIIDKRILFARTDFSFLASLPDTISRELDFRYLSGPRKIPVIGICSAGIPLDSSSPEAASDFINWLMKPETQSLLIRRWEKDGIAVFGFLGGLSSIPEVNESILPLYEASLKNMIPEGHYLQVPASRPLRWPRIRDEVVIPWIQSALTGSSELLPLNDTYRKWDLSSLEETE